MRKRMSVAEGGVTDKFAVVLVVLATALIPRTAPAADTVPLLPVTDRFSDETEEVPSFQRHVVPLFGRLGCNGRACHGSFQGRGGFRLSLFGYDFKADHEALFDQENPRVDIENPDDSLIVYKPTSDEDHEGGQRYQKNSWEHRLIRSWLAAGGKHDSAKIDQLVRLEVSPSEIVFQQSNEQVQLTAVAVWADGTREDVTPLCRFQSNNDQIGTIDENGLVVAQDSGDTHVVVFYDRAVVPVPVMRAVRPELAAHYPHVETPTDVDRLVVQKLKKLGIVPSDICNDAEFLRRVSLDLTGTLPGAREVEQFLADTAADKRTRKIDELLESPAYVAWWTTKLCDFTGNNVDQLNNVLPIRDRDRPSQDWYDWIYKRVAENVPYDRLVAGIVLAKSREDDQDYLDYATHMSKIYREDAEAHFADLETMPWYWARREFRQPPERAISFAYAFMGIRIQCAQCHKHPFDQWSKQDFEEFTKFFDQVTFTNGRAAGSREDRQQYNELVENLGVKGKRGNELRRELPMYLNEGKVVPFGEVIVGRGVGRNRQQSRNNNPRQRTAQLLGSEEVTLSDFADPREPLMDWLQSKDNPFFARAFVNRVWATYFHIGIVEPPDDLSLANPPSNQALLDYLASGFVEHDFDMKWIHREILNSAAYQRSWQPNESNASDLRNFSHAVPRRLPAEVLYDSLVQATATDDTAEQFRTSIEGRAISLAGAGVRYRSGGNASYALSVFGRSTRETSCDCDRSIEPNLLQTVFMQNDNDVLRMLDRRDGWLHQVARDLAPTKDKPAADAKPPADYEQRFNRLRNRQRQLSRQGKTEQAQRLARRLAQLRKQFGDPAALPARAAADVKLADTDVERLIRQGYLRSLSRQPSDEELARATEFMKDAEDPVNGIRGVLWALINTKEFIVNH